MDWLSPWNKRIKLTIDGNKINGDLKNFPLMVKISDSSGINNKDVSDIINTLKSSEIVFYDTCSGSFITNWEDNSNGDSYADYNNGQLRLQLNGGGSAEGVNALTRSSFDITSKYIIEFDWYPAPGSAWYDDDNSDAKNQVSILCTNPVYNTNDWCYNEPEYGVGTKTSFILALRSTKSNKITCYQRWPGGGKTLIDTSFMYGTHHYVKWIIDFDACSLELYMDDQFISQASFDAGVLSSIGSQFKLNFHWHTYAHTGTQYYDNIKITKFGISDKKFIITTAEHEPCYTEIECFKTDYAILWVGVPQLVSGTDSVLYFYYDGDQDNYITVGHVSEYPARQVWDKDYLCVYHLSQNPNNDAANAIKDSTNNFRHGTSGGSMGLSALVESKTGKAIKFDGSDDYIHIPHNVGTFSNQWTIEYMFKSTATTINDDAHVFWEGTGNGCGIYNDSANLTIWSNGVYWTQEITSLVYDGNWHYNVNCWDGSDCYHILDENLVDVKTSFGSNLPNSNLWFGRRSDGENIYEGALDEVRISKIKRSEAYVRATYYTIWDNLIVYSDVEYRPAYYIEGYVKEKGIPVSRLVRLYNRNSGEFVDETTSDGDGYYKVVTSYSGEHFVVAFDDDNGEKYNAVIADRLIPRVVE